MTDNVSFRSSFNGFNREDVVGYIAGLMEKIKDAETKAEERGRQAEEKTRDAQALRQQIEELEKKNRQLSDRCAEVEERSAELSERIGIMERRLSESDKASKNNEEQLGAAMLDAKRFSEMLVKEANDRAGEVYHRAELAVTASASEAGRITEQMRHLSAEFEKNMGDMQEHMADLLEIMAAFKASARDNGAEFLYQTEFSGAGD